jgi:hypothetical protein
MSIETLLKTNELLKEQSKRLERVQSDIDWLNDKGFDFVVIPKSKLNSKD